MDPRIRCRNWNVEATSVPRILVVLAEFSALAEESLDFPVGDERDAVPDDGVDFALFDLAVSPGPVFAKECRGFGDGVGAAMVGDVGVGVRLHGHVIA